MSKVVRLLRLAVRLTNDPFAYGALDAYEQRGTLDNGFTWGSIDDRWKNEAYDRGANLGETLYRALHVPFGGA